jgi:hypothetical protein
VKYYFATGFANVEIVAAVNKALVDAGHVNTYDWSIHHPDHPDRPAMTPAEIALAEEAGVRDADVVFVYLPGGGKGTHSEIGMAVAYQRRVLLIAREGELVALPNGAPAHPSDCVMPLYHHPMVRTYTYTGNAWDPAAVAAAVLAIALNWAHAGARPPQGAPDAEVAVRRADSRKAPALPPVAIAHAANHYARPEA